MQLLTHEPHCPLCLLFLGNKLLNNLSWFISTLGLPMKKKKKKGSWPHEKAKLPRMRTSPSFLLPCFWLQYSSHWNKSLSMVQCLPWSPRKGQADPFREATGHSGTWLAIKDAHLKPATHKTEAALVLEASIRNYSNICGKAFQSPSSPFPPNPEV